jgi:hypothetical protein
VRSGPGRASGRVVGVVELEAGDPVAGRGQSGLGKVSELPAIDKGFENILLDVQVIVDDDGHFVAQYRKMLDRLLTP